MSLPIGYIKQIISIMKLSQCSFLLILIMLWLPIAGAVSAFSPHCTHQNDAGHGLNDSIRSITNNGLHNMAHQQLMDDRMATNQPCEVNTLCHASCSTLVSTAHSTYNSVNNSSVRQSVDISAASFIPDLPQHPPRVYSCSMQH